MAGIATAQLESGGSAAAEPYGIYDLVHNTGFVDVGIDRDTGEFTAESIRRRWQVVYWENHIRDT